MIYKRGAVWWVKVHIGGKCVRQSSHSAKLADAKKLRDRLVGQRQRVLDGSVEQVTVGELLDDLLAHADAGGVKPSTARIWRWVIEGSIRPFFGALLAPKVTTDTLREYRAKRRAEGRKDTTCNRELAVLRIAFRRGLKCTPPKVASVPYFPMRPESNTRTGFLLDSQYTALLRELPSELKGLFVVAYVTAIRKGELLAVRWEQVDLEAGFIALETGATKNGAGRTVPILAGDMRRLLEAAKRERDEGWPESPWVFNRGGEPIRDFRWAWQQACKRAGVPSLHFHDLRRSAVRNMRRCGVPQVVRRKISGHKTDSMERRYSITDLDDITMAKALMEARSPACSPGDGHNMGTVRREGGKDSGKETLD